ncbi:hypothetical protein SDC9_90029 [bioreactor metagenome]|uniref:Uncharacterized protein n=1 Tax=bioreactor metagenome TaxID=1076179 RepID=A0A644ZRG7_9ZZZZ
MGQDDGAAHLLIGVTGVDAQLYVELHGLIEFGGSGLYHQLHSLGRIVQSGLVDELGAVLIFLASKHI